jgi:hypothetical protein
VRSRVLISLVLMLGLVTARAQEAGPVPEKFLGLWVGTWEGGGTGGFELLLDKSKTGGQVTVTGEPAYKATLKSIAFDGAKMTANYDFPPDEQIEITLTAAFDGGKANGNWTARQKTGGAPLASGTWTVAKKVTPVDHRRSRENSNNR